MTIDNRTPLVETLRRRRGHRFFPSVGQARTIPALYETEQVAAPDKTLHVHYFAGGSDWWIAEYDPQTGMAFGYACLGDPQGAEWGYVDLTELEAVAVQRGLVVVERDLHWEPVKAGDAKLPRY